MKFRNFFAFVTSTELFSTPVLASAQQTLTPLPANARLGVLAFDFTPDGLAVASYDDNDGSGIGGTMRAPAG